jgi:hypothetical protein
MGQKDVRDVNAAIAHRGEQLVGFVPGVDYHRLVCPFAADEESVLVKRWDGADFENHVYPANAEPRRHDEHDSVEKNIRRRRGRRG